MRPFFNKTLYFDNYSLHFSKQDCTNHVLLAFFILALPLSARLPHARPLLAASVLFLLFRGIRRWKRHLPRGYQGFCFFAFFLTVLAGAGKAHAALPSLLAAALTAAALLPALYSLPRRVLSRAIALSGALCGAAALLEQAMGRASALWSDAERFGALTRATAFFDNPNILGAFLAPAFLLAVDEMRLSLSRGGWSVWGISSVLCAAGLLTTYSRGAWVGALGGLFLYLYRLYRERSAHQKSHNGKSALSLAPSGILGRALSIFSPDSSVSYRFSLWRGILALPLPPILFGVGEGKRALYSLLSPYMAAGLEAVEHTHSLYFHILCAEGMLGLVFFLAYLFWRFRRRSGERTAALDGALLSLLLYGIFDDPLYSGQIGVLFWILAGAN
jgi:hypothetical protein